ncbi:Serpentine receptor class r-10 [Caenorhabditis elegans]|uniref:Serpentine receptor class r-10 n=1 Tax=Caenorhabditis elegans TaxID=6239 RepID=O16935_CAEEL|nr:Seven TM Receptor [Caenorhabditis elegans]CCD62597.1 Seven TM Receptor [Caenorhabditis elegans]|eukprot:NP_504334.2 Seven TM Receptor [Caenorhabditis elegans]
MSEWQKLQKFSQIFGASISLFLNSLVVLLVAKKSPKALGTYKNLLILIAMFEIIYSVLEVLVKPTFTSFGSTFVMIVNVRDSLLSYDVLLLLVSLCCAFFGSLMVMFSVQFIYRFWAVSGNNSIKTFEGVRIFWWLLPSILVGTMWGIAAYFPCSPRPSTDAFLREFILKEFGLEVTENVYIAPYFYEKNEDGTTDIYYPSFVTIFATTVTVIISVSVIFYFGFKCYTSLQKFKEIESSKHIQNLQNQLFYSLVAQTLIPLFLVHTPAFALYTFSFLRINIGSLTGITTITTAIFPALDPLPTLIIVRSYRNAIRESISSIFNSFTTIFKKSHGNSILPVQARTGTV